MKVKSKKGKTRDELIAESLARLRSGRFVTREVAIPRWSLEKGQEVTVGNLLACHVYDLLNSGREVVVEYTKSPSRDDPGGYQCWQVWHWFDVFPLSRAEPTKVRRFDFTNYSSSSVDSLMYRVNAGVVRDNADYQRGYVWDHRDEINFIEAVFAGRELGKFIFVRFPYPDCEAEVLDGKQRLQAIRGYVQGFWRFEDRFFWELHPMDRHLFESTRVQFVDLDGARYRRSELLSIFLEVNAAGVPQSEEHLAVVRQLRDAAVAAEGCTVGLVNRS